MSSKFYRIKLIVFFLSLLFNKAFSNSEIILSKQLDRVLPAHYFELIEYTGTNLDSVIFGQGQIIDTESIPTFGFSSENIWLRLVIYNDTPLDNISLSVKNPQIDSFHLYKRVDNNLLSLGLQGDKIHLKNPTVSKVQIRYQIPIKYQEKLVLYINIASEEQISLPLRISDITTQVEKDFINNLFFGLYAGIMLVMFFYNLILFLIVKDRSYLYYIIYIFSIGITQASIAGYTKVLIWPTMPFFHQFAIVFFSCLAGFGAIAFAQRFLELKKNAPIINKGLNIFYYAYALTFISYIIGFKVISYSLLNFSGLFVAAYAIFFAIHLSIKGLRTAKFYLTAWLFFLSGIIIFVLRNLGFIGFNFLTEDSVQIGSAIEAILLSIALADRINILKKEKETSQALALQTAKENERIIKEQNIILEEKVEERTLELTKSNQDLEATLNDLKEAQTQLVESEKMASLGQLTAGVAHEINNPINFVSSNIKPLERDIEDIISIINRYDELSEENIKIEIDKLKQDVDYDNLKDEIIMLLKGIQEGANRTVEIVQSLRNFSRLDEHDLKKADVRDGLDSTLVLLNSSMAGVIHVNKNYDHIPEIDCYPGKLNQVFMNIMSNAVYAIQKKYGSNQGGELSLSTSQSEDFVTIKIKDNGIGMSKETLQKVFEPFFTSKPVGEGTGLGLSIVYKIIENHNGQIAVNSQEGEWTEFTITLPKMIQN